MKFSGIGGQALMEGVMMRNKGRYACTVRKSDGTLAQKIEDYNNIGGSDRLRQIPFVRGPIIFLDSMKLGMSTLSWSASFFEEEERKDEGDPCPLPDAGEGGTAKAVTGEGDSKQSPLMAASILFALVLGIGLFVILPTVLVKLLRGVISSSVLISLLEGLVRIGIFLLYLALISRMKEIKRTFMYHGAEHKCINCIEHGLALTVENVRKSSRFHPRCGTSFILFTLIVSILVGIFLPRDPLLLRVGTKLLALPLIMSLSYEFIHLAGSRENQLLKALSQPGLWLQRLTTQEPTEDMIEVGMASTEAVFDWKAWQEEHFEH